MAAEKMGGVRVCSKNLLMKGTAKAQFEMDKKVKEKQGKHDD